MRRHAHAKPEGMPLRPTSGGNQERRGGRHTPVGVAEGMKDWEKAMRCGVATGNAGGSMATGSTTGAAQERSQWSPRQQVDVWPILPEWV